MQTLWKGKEMSANDELQAHTCEKMLEFYGNVANNVAQRNSQDLTKQWKRGKLETGEEYWVILTDELYLLSPGVPVRAFYSCDCEFEGYLDNDIKQVLAPVPSYEQWQAKLEENQRLKDLLKGCGKQLYEYSDVCLQEGYEIEREEVLKLKTKIDEVLK